MSKYFCPFCDPKYQFPKKDSNGKIYCGLCGDYMFREPTINLKKILAILLSSSFIIPIFLILLFTFLNEVDNKKNKDIKLTILGKMNLDELRI